MPERARDVLAVVVDEVSVTEAGVKAKVGE
jgi:hypothetical protein